MSNIGSYSLKLHARFDIPVDYEVSQSFVVNLRNKCEQNVIMSAKIPDMKYFIGDPALDYTFFEWTMDLPICGPILSYAASMGNGQGIPKFIKFDQKIRKISVSTSFIGDFGQN